MSKRKKSKLKAMAKAGNPWAIRTLREAQERGRAAALKGIAMQRAAKAAGSVTAKAAPADEPIRIEFEEPLTGLTLPNRRDAELALSILAKAGVNVKSAESVEPEFKGYEDRDIVLDVLNEPKPSARNWRTQPVEVKAKTPIVAYDGQAPPW